MTEDTHLYEADMVRIANEAKVRAALEDPDSARREFEKWREQREKGMGERADTSFVTAWARVAYLAEGRMVAMGRDVNKLQGRIGRQRRANKRMVQALKEKDARIAELEESLGIPYDRGYQDGFKDGEAKGRQEARKEA